MNQIRPNFSVRGVCETLLALLYIASMVALLLLLVHDMRASQCVVPDPNLFNEFAYEALRNSTLRAFDGTNGDPYKAVERTKVEMKKTKLNLLRLVLDPTIPAKDIICCNTNFRTHSALRIRYTPNCTVVPPRGISLDPTVEFFEIKCCTKIRTSDSTTTHQFHIEYHSRLVKKPSRKKRPSLPGPTPPSILIVCVKSVSTQHAIRSLPNAMEFLQSENYLQFRGFSRVTSNINDLLEIIIGRRMLTSQGDLKENSGTTDIFTSFSAYNYTTLAAFPDAGEQLKADYNLAAFLNIAPTRYRNYDDQLAYSAESSKRKATLNYVSEFLHEFSAVPTVAVMSLSPTQPSSYYSLGHMDVELTRFFYHISNATSNTFVIIASDGGLSSGHGYELTKEGFEEMNLPFLMMRAPNNVSALYPKAEAALLTNLRRLVTPYDIHETLKHILRASIGQLEDSPHQAKITASVGAASFGKSILEALPEFRTCDRANVPVEYCACAERTVYSELPLTEESTQRAAYLVLSHINQYVKTYLHEHHKLKLKTAQVHMMKNCCVEWELGQVIQSIATGRSIRQLIQAKGGNNIQAYFAGVVVFHSFENGGGSHLYARVAPTPFRIFACEKEQRNATMTNKCGEIFQVHDLNFLSYCECQPREIFQRGLNLPSDTGDIRDVYDAYAAYK